jgi:hypothetical protein
MGNPKFLFGSNCGSLEQVPQELVVDLVVELDFLRFDERA